MSAQFVLCFVAHGLQAIAFNLFVPFPKYLNALGASDALVGWSMSLTGLAALATRPALARALDRTGRRTPILVGGALNVIACASYLLVDRIGPMLFAARLLHGVAEAMLFSALFTFAADYVPASRRTQGLALFGVSGMLPIALGAALGDWLGMQRSWDEVFLTASGLAALSLALSFGLRDAPRARIAPGDRSASLAAVLRQRDLVPIWALGAVFAIVLTAFFVFVPRFVQDTGVGSVAHFMTSYVIAALILRIFFGWLPDRIGPRRALLPALSCLVVGLALMAQASAARDVIVAGFLCGLGHGFAFPILSGMVVNRVSDAARGAALAIFTGLFDVGLLLGGPLFGLVVEIAGFPALYALASLTMASGIALFARWDARVAPRHA